jgi:hypothetical protein
MAAKPNKGFLEKVEEEIDKQGRGVQLAAAREAEGKKDLVMSVALDQLGDKSAQWIPQGLVKAGGVFEQARRFLQQGTVPGAAKKAAAAKVATATGVKAAGKIGSAPIQAGIELAKGGYLIGKEGAREGHAEAGRELAKEPLAYQAANLLVSPADALSKYGAAREAKGKKDFEERYINPLKRLIEAEDERKLREEQSNRDVPAVEIRKGAQPNPRKFFR